MINLILHSLQPSRGAVNFILAQLYIGVNTDTAEPGSMVQAEEGVTPPVVPPKRGRKKKTVDEAEATVNMEVKTSPESTDPAPQAPTDASAGTPPAKPKRTRRVGEPKPKRYPVGEKDPEQGM
jgi:hypothetical protein